MKKQQEQRLNGKVTWRSVFVEDGRSTLCMLDRKEQLDVVLAYAAELSKLNQEQVVSVFQGKNFGRLIARYRAGKEVRR